MLSFLKSRTFVANLILALSLLLVVCYLSFSYLDFTTNHGEQIEVPQLVGKSIFEAEELLAQNELSYVILDSIWDESKPKETILSQLPEAKDFVKTGRSIYITVNTQLAPKIEVPNLVDKSLRQAQSTLDAIGFQYELSYQQDICVDCVLQQLYNGKTIPEGAKIRKGDTITLVIGTAGNHTHSDSSSTSANENFNEEEAE